MFVHKDQSYVIKMLRKQINDLEDEKESVKRYVGDPYHQREASLQEWLVNATNFIQTAHDLVENVGKHGKNACPVWLCLNPKSPFQLRMKAEQICKDIAAHVQKAREFSAIPLSYRQDKVAADRFEDFESRSGVLKDIMEALRSPCIRKIGVHGKPGMGKTMMVREVKRRAELEGLFDAVVMATVGRNPDFPRIQDEIALGLGLNPVSNELISLAAPKSNEASLIEKKVFVILDDIWKSGLSLELLGINGKEKDNFPYKILLTSRDRDVVSALSETQFEIGILAWEEAWNLFKKMADDPDKSRGLPFYANEITEKCEKLPIAVVMLANALRRRNLIEWKTTLRKLQSPPSNQPNSSQIPQSLHSVIEVLYSGLKSDELQQTFLLCSLLGQNATTQNLLKYGIGLGLFPGVNSIQKARAQVLNLVTKLRNSSLLLDSGTSSYFEMHDLVRDFATSTASEEHGVLALRDDAPINWSDTEKMKSIKWIYLSNSDTILLPYELKCPKLTFFHLSNEGPLASPPNLFRDKEGLRVLSFSKMNFLAIPSLFSLPKNLCTLCLEQVELGPANIGTMMGELENLQVLSLAGSDIKELPKQIGQLTNLKLLDLSDCTKLKVIPSGILSSLSGLEELYMRNSFNQWAESIEKHKIQNANLAELMHLKLTALEVRIICNIQNIPDDLFSENLEIFKVFLGDRWNYWESSWGSSKLLKLKLDARISPHHSVRKMLKKTNELHLEGLIGVENVVNELDEEGFQELKYLFVQDALQIQHIISVEHAFPILEVLVLSNLKNMEKICHGPLGAASFRKLRLLTIECCNKLRNLFSASIAKQLQQIQEIRVKDCSNMEEIVDDEEQGSGNEAKKPEEHKFLKLINLRTLSLQHLPKLTSFNSSCRNMAHCNEKVVFLSNIEELQLSSIMVNTTIWHTSMISCVESLTKLIIHGCDNLEYLFLSSMARGLSKLRRLQVKECKRIRMIITEVNGEEEEKRLIFSELKFLFIEDLPNLVGFYLENCVVEFPSLKHLQVLNCLKLEKFIAGTNFLYGVQSLFNEQVVFSSNLEELQLCSINLINTICDTLMVVFSSNLEELQLCSINLINTICDTSMVSCFQKLGKLIIHDCNNLEYLFTSSMPRASERIELLLPKLKRLELGDLPQLKSMDSQRATIVCDSLERIIIWNCYNLRRFPLHLPLLENGQPSPPPSLKQIVVWPQERWKSLEWDHPNAEAVLQPFNESYHSFPFELVQGRIKRLVFTEIDVENTWLLPSVQELVLDQFNNLRSLNDISATKDAKELKCFRIWNCNGVERVFSSSINPLVQKLEVLDLYRLENLEALFEAEAITKSPLPLDNFASLKTLSVRQCDKIKKLFPFRMCLQSLEEVSIVSCDEMEEIIAWDAEESGGEKEGVIQLILPKLRSLKLIELLALKSICSKRVVMVCDSLEEIQIKNCQGLRRIPFYLPLLDNEQPSPPPSLKQIKVCQQGWGSLPGSWLGSWSGSRSGLWSASQSRSQSRSWWESLEWDHPNAKDVLLPFYKFTG